MASKHRSECPQTRALCQALQAYNVYTILNVGSSMSSGVPDRALVTGRGIVYVEFKSDTRKVTEKQRQTMSHMNARTLLGGSYPCAIVVRFVGPFIHFETGNGSLLHILYEPTAEAFIKQLYMCTFFAISSAIGEAEIEVAVKAYDTLYLCQLEQKTYEVQFRCATFSSPEAYDISCRGVCTYSKQLAHLLCVNNGCRSEDIVSIEEKNDG